MWVWLALGILTGFVIIILTRINGRYADEIPTDTVTQGQTSEQTTKRKFDFYTLLPELEVVIPKEETKPPTIEKPIKDARTIHTDGYLLQAGSFKKFNDADSLKTQLDLLGVEAYIQSVEVDSIRWHRVRIGPVNDRQSLERLRNRLRTNHIDTLLMRAEK